MVNPEKLMNDEIKNRISRHEEWNYVLDETDHWLPVPREDGSTILHEACSSREETGICLLRYLLHRCSEMETSDGEKFLNAANDIGMTALHSACANPVNGERAVRYLMQARPRFEIKLDNGIWRMETPLHLACRNANGDRIVRLLLGRESNVDVNKKDITSRTPMHYAQGNEAISNDVYNKMKNF